MLDINQHMGTIMMPIGILTWACQTQKKKRKKKKMNIKIKTMVTSSPSI